MDSTPATQSRGACDDLRIKAMDYALEAMKGAPFTEIVLAAQAFHVFLGGSASATPAHAFTDDQIVEGLRSLLNAGGEGFSLEDYRDSIAACASAPPIAAPTMKAFAKPPPIPDLVQQVAAVASAPPGCRPDLSHADQSPPFDDVKTRLIRPAQRAQ